MALDITDPIAPETVSEPDGVIAIEPADRPWDEMVLVCSKCCNKIGPHTLGADGHSRLRTELKALIRAEPSAYRTRVSEVSCLGVCPDDRITVGAFHPDGQIRMQTVSPTVTAAEALEYLRAEGAIAPRVS